MENVSVKDNTANPGPWGMLGFGMTTIMLSLSNAGFFPLDAVILTLALFLGGTTQVIAATMEWKKGNTIGTYITGGYGMFWIMFVSIVLLPQMADIPAPGHVSMAAYYVLWLLFTTMGFVCSLSWDTSSQVTFALIIVLIACLIGGEISLENGCAATAAGFFKAAGWVGIFGGGSAFYNSLATGINSNYGRVVLPLDCRKKKANDSLPL